MSHMVKYPDRRDGVTLFDFYGNVIVGGGGGTATVQTVAAATGTQLLDWNAGNWADVTMSGNTTFSFASLTLGRTFVLTLRGAFVPTWPTVAWQPGPTAPAYTDGGTGMSFEFWVTKTGEIRGSAVIGS